MSTDRVEIQKSVVVDEDDHQPELIHMPGQHHRRISLGIQGRDPVPHRIHLIQVSMTLHMAVKHRLSLRLIPRRRPRMQKFRQKIGRHGCGHTDILPEPPFDSNLICPHHVSRA